MEKECKLLFLFCLKSSLLFNILLAGNGFRLTVLPGNTKLIIRWNGLNLGRNCRLTIFHLYLRIVFVSNYSDNKRFTNSSNSNPYTIEFEHGVGDRALTQW